MSPQDASFPSKRSRDARREDLRESIRQKTPEELLDFLNQEAVQEDLEKLGLKVFTNKALQEILEADDLSVEKKKELMKKLFKERREAFRQDQEKRKQVEKVLSHELEQAMRDLQKDFEATKFFQDFKTNQELFRQRLKEGVYDGEIEAFEKKYDVERYHEGFVEAVKKAHPELTDAKIKEYFGSILMRFDQEKSGGNFDWKDVLDFDIRGIAPMFIGGLLIHQFTPRNRTRLHKLIGEREDSTWSKKKGAFMLGFTLLMTHNQTAPAIANIVEPTARWAGRSLAGIHGLVWKMSMGVASGELYDAFEEGNAQSEIEGVKNVFRYLDSRMTSDERFRLAFANIELMHLTQQMVDYLPETEKHQFQSTLRHIYAVRQQREQAAKAASGSDTREGLDKASSEAAAFVGEQKDRLGDAIRGKEFHPETPRTKEQIEQSAEDVFRSLPDKQSLKMMEKLFQGYDADAFATFLVTQASREIFYFYTYEAPEEQCEIFENKFIDLLLAPKKSQPKAFTTAELRAMTPQIKDQMPPEKQKGIMKFLDLNLSGMMLSVYIFSTIAANGWGAVMDWFNKERNEKQKEKVRPDKPSERKITRGQARSIRAALAIGFLKGKSAGEESDRRVKGKIESTIKTLESQGVIDDHQAEILTKHFGLESGGTFNQRKVIKFYEGFNPPGQEETYLYNNLQVQKDMRIGKLRDRVREVLGKAEVMIGDDFDIDNFEQNAYFRQQDQLHRLRYDLKENGRFDTPIVINDGEVSQVILEDIKVAPLRSRLRWGWQMKAFVKGQNENKTVIVSVKENKSEGTFSLTWKGKSGDDIEIKSVEGIDP